LTGEDHRKPVGGIEQDAIELETAAQTGLDFSLSGEAAGSIEDFPEEVPHVSAPRVLAYAISRELDRAFIISAVEEELDRPVAPFDAPRHAFRRFLDESARLFQAAVPEKNLHEVASKMHVLRISRDRILQNPAGFLPGASELVNPGELNLSSRVRGVPADDLPHHPLRFREPPQL
jgi:hypothetical protein